MWAPDYRTQSVRRNQDSQSIACSSPEFDRGVYILRSDFVSFVRTFVGSCVKWKGTGPEMSLDEMARLYELFEAATDE